MTRPAAGALLLPLLLPPAAPRAAAAERIAEASVLLEVTPPPVAGRVPEADPPRFVLLENGTVYVGGTGVVASGRLEKEELKPLEKQIAQLRKLPGLGAPVTLGPGAARHRLSLRRGPVIVATGDPAQAPPALRPLAALLETLLAFDHPSLRPYRPSQYAVSARLAEIQGGCRGWGFGVALAEAVKAPQAVSADAASGWPTGSVPASVCADKQTYLVALRPLLPGEAP